MSVHAQAQTRSTQKHYARTTRHDTRLLSTTLRAHAPKQPTTPHSRATPAPTQAHRRCPRATALLSTGNLTRSAPSRHCAAGGKGAIRQTHARRLQNTRHAHASARKSPHPRAHEHTHTYMLAPRVHHSRWCWIRGGPAGTGGARSTGGPAHTKQQTRIRGDRSSRGHVRPLIEHPGTI